jgi:hypothetical protein
MARYLPNQLYLIKQLNNNEFEIHSIHSFEFLSKIVQLDGVVNNVFHV